MEEKFEPERTQTETTLEKINPKESKITRMKSWVKPLVFTFLSILIVAGLLFGSHKFTQIRQSQIVPPLTPTPLIKPTVFVEEMTNWETYSDVRKRLTFNAPTNWKVNSYIVPKGTIKRETRGYDIHAEKGDVEVINISKVNDYIIRVELRKDFQYCGGLLGFTKEDYDHLLRKAVKIPFLGFDAYRPNLENGEYESAADEPSPYTQGIVFEGSSYKVTDPKNFYYGKTLYNVAFCYENSSVPVQISISYLSSKFTKDIIVNKKLDYATIQEMDKILRSYKFSN